MLEERGAGHQGFVEMVVVIRALEWVSYERLSRRLWCDLDVNVVPHGKEQTAVLYSRQTHGEDRDTEFSMLCGSDTTNIK